MFPLLSLALVIILGSSLMIAACKTNKAGNMTASTFNTNVETKTTNIYDGIRYHYFELTPDDFHLSLPDEYFKPQLFSFEYPDLIKYVDPANYDTHTLSRNSTDFEFLGDEINRIPQPEIYIFVQRPPFRNQNTLDDVFNALKVVPYSVHNVIENNIKIAGCQAKYLEFTSEMIYEDYYRPHIVSLKAMVFQYQGCFWTIKFLWSFVDSEPPEVKKYFNHIVETFKFLE
jgi:hypothetical protein